MIVNNVITKDLNSRIFQEIFRRHVDNNLPREDGFSMVVSEKPLANADIYHYHRVHLEVELKQPAVVTVHHDPSDLDVWVDATKFMRHYCDAQRVICLNELQALHLRKLGILNMVVIPHGYDSTLFKKKPLPEFGADKIKLGMLSRRYDRRVKGEVLLYELMERLDPNRFSFIFVGEGRGTDAAFAEELGFECQVFEALPYRLFPRIYEAIDFLLMISNFEGGPANIPEAVASGTPVLCRPIGMAADLIVDGVNGKYLSGDADVDAEIISSLAALGGSLFGQLIDGAHKTNTAISWERNIEMHRDVYRQVLGVRRIGEESNCL